MREVHSVKIVGMMAVRNEDWVLGFSARVALMWCDALVIFDHASTDRTPQIITDLEKDHPGRVHRHREDSLKWDEMAHRQTMLEMARATGATHMAIIDADEIVTGNIVDKMRGFVTC